MAFSNKVKELAKDLCDISRNQADTSIAVAIFDNRQPDDSEMILVSDGDIYGLGMIAAKALRQIMRDYDVPKRKLFKVIGKMLDHDCFEKETYDL